MSALLAQQMDQSVAEVFALMLGLACQPCTGSLPLGEDSLLASVAFSGCLRGACTVGMERHTASLLTERLLGIAPDSLTTEDALSLLADTLGELCNMIAGGWKSRLDSSNACCSLAPPRQLDARPSQLASNAETIYRCYTFSETGLVVEITLEAANIKAT